MSAILQTKSKFVADGTDSPRPGLGPWIREVSGAAAREDRDDRWQGVFAAMPGAVLVLDGRGRIIDANPAALALFDQPLIGEMWRQVVRRDFGRPLDRGDLMGNDGHRYSVATRPLGSAPGQIVLLTDVTESRELQARLAHQERLASMGQMAASLAHQIRTPLSTALLYASHLDNPSVDGEQRGRFVGRLRGRLQHLEQMVRDLLMFSRSGGFECQALSVSRLFDGLAEEMLPRLTASDGELRLEGSVDRRLWGNFEALRAALLNLAMNALQAQPRGLALELRAEVLTAGTLEIRVSDNGPGIGEKDRGQVFEPFFTTRSDGTGLGLPVVRSVIEAHGGRIELAPVSTGTCFRICLPQIDGADHVTHPGTSEVV